MRLPYIHSSLSLLTRLYKKNPAIPAPIVPAATTAAINKRVTMNLEFPELSL